jgi:prolyl-tRNA synthetase
MKKERITPRLENYSQWYLDVIREADLAENSIVRGCMVIKPNGYSIWEKVQEILGKMIKDTGHRNVYFPIFIPKSLLNKEAEHVEGFAKESAVVTHHRLKVKEGRGLIVDPDSKLEEEVIVRPTSEAIMYDTFANWIKSYRDLPVLVNQWCNIVRWEMRTRLFLRTSEFLWQEGHTAHATQEEAEEEAVKMLEVYRKFIREYMAIPTIGGRKSELERFPGALHTYTVEAMMQDCKALQMGTSHNLGDNFAKAFNIKYLDSNNKEQYAWQTSWGVSTRLIGGLIMTHSDDSGLILPPKIAYTQVVIIPISREQDEEARKIKDNLEEVGISVEIDTRDHLTPGFKFNQWEKRGIPVRIEVGPKDVEKKVAVVCRRDTGEKEEISVSDLGNKVPILLEDIQRNLLKKAEQYLEKNIHDIDNYEDFKRFFKQKQGFIRAFWNEDKEAEIKIKDETGATTRCLDENAKGKGKCIITGKESTTQWIFGIAY